MEKLCIITPGFLPVPSKKNGAIEVLIETLITNNELINKYEISVYSIFDESVIMNKRYNNCAFFYVKPNIVDKIISVAYNKSHRYFINKNAEDYISPYSVSVRRAIKRKDFDYILIENNLTVVNCLKNKKNLIFHLHNEILGFDKPEFQCKLALDRCKLVISVSDYIKRRLLTLGDYKNVKVLYNCVSTELFSPSKNNEKTFNFLYSGRLVPEKGVYELVCAFHCVKNLNAKLYITGRADFMTDQVSEYESKIYKVAQKDRRIEFTGFVEHNCMPDILSKIDCVVIPTVNEEPFGVVALEAIASSKIIICTKSGELPRIVDNYGIIVDRNNLIDNLTNAINEVLDNREKYEMLAKIGYKKLLSTVSYNSKYYLKNFINIIDNYESIE